MSTNLNEVPARESITEKVIAVLSKLPKDHTRRDAFAALRNARIMDKDGNPIVPSVWYHHVSYTATANGTPIINRRFPDFVPAPTPYPRAKVEEEKDNSMHASIHSDDRFVGMTQDEILSKLNSQLSETMEMIRVFTSRAAAKPEETKVPNISFLGKSARNIRAA